MSCKGLASATLNADHADGMFSCTAPATAASLTAAYNSGNAANKPTALVCIAGSAPTLTANLA